MDLAKVAESLAAELFPDEVANGSDCKNEHGRIGLPCRVCAERNDAWIERVKQVFQALIKAVDVQG